MERNFVFCFSFKYRPESKRTEALGQDWCDACLIRSGVEGSPLVMVMATTVRAHATSIIINLGCQQSESVPGR